MTTHPNVKRYAVAMFLLMLCSTLRGQAPQSDTEWRRRPQSVETGLFTNVPPMLRAARDKFFDRVLGAPSGGGEQVWEKPFMIGEIPTFAPYFTVVVADFADYITILSSSKKSIYTEVTLNVERVLRDPSGFAKAGSTLVVELPGGTLKLPSGKIVDTFSGDDYGIQPGHRYLLFLSYESAGGFFLYQKSWDLTNKVATPNFEQDVALARTGTSHYAGLPEDKFLVAVEQILVAADKQRMRTNSK